MIYAVIAHQGTETLRAAITRRYPDHYHLPPACWFVADMMSSEGVSAALGITEGKLPGVQAVILPVSNYYGYAPADLWNWLRAHWSPG